MTNTDMSKEREAFEAHWLKEGNPRNSLAKWQDSDGVPLNHRGTYVMACTRYAWSAFQAGRASLQSPGFSAEDMATASAQGFRDGVASLSANAGEPLVRYCPGCGSVGPVEEQYRDCCPDGGRARMIPEPLANQCRNTFQIAIRELTGSGVAASAGSEPVAYCFAEELQSATENGDVFDAWTKESTGAMPLYTHPSPPEGMVMVPKEPTEAMKTAAVKYANGSAVYKNVKADVLRIEEGIYGEVYEAMIAAAPPTSSADSRKGE